MKNLAWLSLKVNCTREAHLAVGIEFLEAPLGGRVGLVGNNI